jgi:hypothetical protein
MKGNESTVSPALGRRKVKTERLLADAKSKPNGATQSQAPVGSGKRGYEFKDSPVLTGGLCQSQAFGLRERAAVRNMVEGCECGRRWEGGHRQPKRRGRVGRWPKAAKVGDRVVRGSVSSLGIA